MQTMTSPSDLVEVYSVEAPARRGRRAKAVPTRAAEGALNPAAGRLRQPPQPSAVAVSDLAGHPAVATRRPRLLLMHVLRQPVGHVRRQQELLTPVTRHEMEAQTGMMRPIGNYRELGAIEIVGEGDEDLLGHGRGP